MSFNLVYFLTPFFAHFQVFLAKFTNFHKITEIFSCGIRFETLSGKNQEANQALVANKDSTLSTMREKSPQAVQSLIGKKNR